MTPYTVAFRKPSNAEETLLCAGQQFRFEINEYERFFGKRVPDVFIDLLRIASAIYFTDRLMQRKRRDQRRYWSRSLILKVGVLQPDRWSSNDVRDAVADGLEFLTDDAWELIFEKDDQRTGRQIQRALFSIPVDSRVCLYSGGLDSAAGLANQVATDADRHVLPVTVWHQPIQRKMVQRQYDLLRSKLDVTISPLIVKAARIWMPDLAHIREELSQRSRAFLFMAAGGAAAAMAGASTIEVYESGIGAINLPLMAGMVGSRTTRSAHPEFLRKMSRLVSLIAEQEITFKLPFMDRTKGQIVKALTDHGLAELPPTTVSCVHYPLRESKHKQCGVCPACIFRRQALLVAGIQEPPGTYKFDLFGSPSRANRISPKRLKHLKAFLDQVVQLTDVKPNHPMPARIRRHLFGTAILKAGQSPEPIIQLLGQYRDEWKDITARTAEQGFSWTKLITSPGPRMEGASRASA